MPAVIRKGKVIATCDICGKMAHHGYGPLWSCREHMTDVAKLWELKGSPQK